MQHRSVIVAKSSLEDIIGTAFSAAVDAETCAPPSPDATESKRNTSKADQEKKNALGKTEEKRDPSMRDVKASAPSGAVAQPINDTKKIRGGQRKVIKKDRSISLRINGALWDRFQQINELIGLPSAAVVNQLITSYVRDKASEYAEDLADE